MHTANSDAISEARVNPDELVSTAKPQTSEQHESAFVFLLRALAGRPRQLDSQSVLNIYGKWQPPNEETAKQKYHAAHIQHQTFDWRAAELKDFKEFGAGHLLYFYFLKFLAVVCAVMAAISGIPMILIYSSGGFLATNSDFDRTSLGNFGLPSNTQSVSGLNITLPSTNKGADAELVILNYFLSQSDAPSVAMDNTGWDKLKALTAASAMDLIGAVFYFMACLFLVWRTRAIAVQVDRRVTSLPDYSVQVEGLPPDTRPDELITFFEQWGDVAQVECARRCNILMTLVLDRESALEDLDKAIAVLQRSADLTPQVDEDLELEVLNLQYDLSLLTEAIQARQISQGGADVVRAYVTYKESKSKEAALQAQPTGLIQRWKKRKEIPKFRDHYKLRVGTAPEATDIRFENLEFDPLDRFIVRFGTWACKAVAVAVGFVLVSIAPSIKRNLGSVSDMPSVKQCDANCEWKTPQGALYLNDTMRAVYKQCFDTGVYDNLVSCQGASICYECYCKTALSSSMYNERAYCSAFESVLIQSVLAQALTVVSIVAVNQIVTRLIKWITQLELHRTRTREGWSAMAALFSTQFINTAFSILFANAYMPELQAQLPETWQKVLFGGIYADTTPNWYREVGKAILISHIIGLPIRMGSILIDVIEVKWAINRKSAALTQVELDKAYQGYEFLLAPRYGEQLSVVFVGLLFAPGLPLLYFSLTFSFIVHYWLERWELLTVCKWPNAVDPSLAYSVANILPFAVLGHFLAAAWMISLVGTPHSPIIGDSWTFEVVKAICNATSRLWATTNQLTPAQMAIRLTNTGAAHHLYAFAIMAILIFVFFTFQTWIAVYKNICEWVGRKPADGSDGSTDQSNDTSGGGVTEFPIAVRSQLIVGPTTYSMRTNPNYAHAFERLDDVTLADKIIMRVEEKEMEARKQIPRNFREHRRRARRDRARQLLNQEGAALMKRGHAAQHTERLHTAGSTAAQLLGEKAKNNQVAPWAGAEDDHRQSDNFMTQQHSSIMGSAVGIPMTIPAVYGDTGTLNGGDTTGSGVPGVREQASLVQPGVVSTVPIDAHGATDMARAHGSRLA